MRITLRNRFPDILQNLFLTHRLHLRLFNSSKRWQFSPTYFFKFLQNNFLTIITHHFYHLFHFLNSMRLIHTLQKERQFFNRNRPIVIDVNSIKSFPDIIIRKKLPVDIITCIFHVEYIFCTYFFILDIRCLLWHLKYLIRLTRRTEYFYSVLVIWWILTVYHGKVKLVYV